MSWTNLTLESDWSVKEGNMAPRVRILSNLVNTAELEGTINYSGSEMSDVAITLEGSGLPVGCYDPDNVHVIIGACYDSLGNPLGPCQILIDMDGNVAIGDYMPESTYQVIFSSVYPTA